uniref:Uncharacterized protein n=1 Tax=Candidatus Methanomethylicus mesodigestus TaxID=1867258 RepID=A0A7C3J514_9CREN
MDVYQPLIALFLGLISIASPCVLPILPGYVAYLFGNDAFSRLTGAVSILCGIMIGGLSIGLCLSAIQIEGYAKWFYLISSFIVAFLLIDVLTHRFTHAVGFQRFLSGRRGVMTGFVFGLLLILIASPCIVPFLTVTAIFALSFEDGIMRLVSLACFSLGLGIPFILVGSFTSSAERLRGFVNGRRFAYAQVCVLAGTFTWLIWSFATS